MTMVHINGTSVKCADDLKRLVVIRSRLLCRTWCKHVFVKQVS